MRIDPRQWTEEQLHEYRRRSASGPNVTNVVEDKRKLGVVFTYDVAGRLYAVAFAGKSAKSSFYYPFRSEQSRAEQIALFWKGVEESHARKLEWAARRKAKRCDTPQDVYNKAIAAKDYLTAPDVAVCLRAALARRWPSTKFSVRSDRCLNVSWTDGPGLKEVEAIAQRYSFEGFDGMIDMRYSKTRWLTPDGEMSLAHSTGTTSSAGCDPEAIGDPHSYQAIEVNATCDFVFCSRSIGFSLKLDLTKRVCAMYGVDLPEIADTTSLERFLNQTSVHGDYLSHLVYQASTGALKIAA